MFSATESTFFFMIVYHETEIEYQNSYILERGFSETTEVCQF